MLLVKPHNFFPSTFFKILAPFHHIPFLLPITTYFPHTSSRSLSV